MHNFQYVYDVVTPKIRNLHILCKFVPISPRKAGPYFLIKDVLIEGLNTDIGEKIVLVTFIRSIDKTLRHMMERWSIKW